MGRHAATLRRREPFPGGLRSWRRSRGAGRRRRHPLLASLWQTIGRAGGVVWSDCHEHAGGTPAGVPGIASRKFPEEVKAFTTEEHGGFVHEIFLRVT